MSHWRLVVLTLVVAIAPVGLRAQLPVYPAVPAGGMVEIDGAKNPELLPEYLVWSTAFQSLALVKKHASRESTERPGWLRLSAGDEALVFAAADRNTEHAVRCHERGVAIVSRMRERGERAPAIDAAMKANTLECRWGVLDARDRLLAALSAEGGTTLISWVLRERAKVKSHVARSELDFYRQPR